MFLKDIGSVTRIDLKPYCFEISAKDKTYYVSCKSDEELYSWMDEIYNVSMDIVSINNPINSYNGSEILGWYFWTNEFYS